MMPPIRPRVFYGGLFILVAGLFIATFMLNRSQYRASAASVGLSLNSMLDQQTATLRSGIAQQEATLFSLHNTSEALDAKLFTVTPSSVVPAVTAELLNTIPVREAEEAFQQGLETRPNMEALPFLKKAAKCRVETPENLYLKIGAHFNILEIEYDVQIVCCILALLDGPAVSLTDSQNQFFNELLEKQVPNLALVREEMSTLWEKAELIDKKLTRQKGSYRAVIDGQTLSVTGEGLALLYTPEIQAIAPVKLSQSEPGGLHKQVAPGLFASIPNHAVERAKVKIQNQYWTGNAILTLMLLLGSGLAVGLFATSRRQRELDKMKTEFIATVSHELRTPLSLIRLHAETLHYGRIPESKIGDYHQTILTEAERLTGIVNNVLDFSRMERGKMQLHPESTDLSVLCERVIESFHSRLEQNGFELEESICTGIIGPVDPLAYSQILFNLFDNALKYSDDDKHIRIELESSNGWNILRVSDRGIGIPDKLKKKIFDDFTRSNDNKVTARRGSGIGLSVARRLTEKMHGTIEVKDNEPTGSVFTVKFRNGNETIGS